MFYFIVGVGDLNKILKILLYTLHSLEQKIANHTTLCQASLYLRQRHSHGISAQSIVSWIAETKKKELSLGKKKCAFPMVPQYLQSHDSPPQSFFFRGGFTPSHDFFFFEFFGEVSNACDRPG